MRSESKFSKEGLNDFLQKVDEEILLFVKANCSGLLWQMAREHLSVSGKKIRPKIVYQLGQLIGLQPEQLIPWASSCELLHNATLIHDDIQDGDRIRRGHPTVWSRYGPEQAINLGDLLLLLAPQPILHSGLGDKTSRALSLRLSKTSAQLVSGQTLEFQLNQLKDPEGVEKSYHECIANKTSALFSGLAAGVALIANQSLEQRIPLEGVFFHVGKVFQMQDDIVDLWGNKQRHEIGCDVKEGKVSFLIAKHLTIFPQDHLLIRAILLKNREDTGYKDILNLKNIFEQKGTLQLALVELKQTVNKVYDMSLQTSVTGLQNYALQLIDEILQPISHIRDDVVLKPRGIFTSHPEVEFTPKAIEFA